MNNARFAFLVGMILVAAASRLIPHPPNFTPIAAMALFGGASFSDKRIAFLVPFAAMFLSDVVLGFNAVTPMIYGSFALIVCLGFWVRRHRALGPLAAMTVLSAVLFFVITNFGVWALGHLYPLTGTGLVECFVAAIPFFANTLLSDLLYSVLLFGSVTLAENLFADLREDAIPA